MMATIVATNTNLTVIGRAPAISEITGWFSLVRPKSALPTNTPKTPRSQMKYLIGGGRSKRSSRVKFIINCSRFGAVLVRRSSKGSVEIAAMM